jgi:hypothetical protein
MKLEFSQKSFEKTQISSLIKIRPVEAELFYVAGRDEATSRFSKFWESA